MPTTSGSLLVAGTTSDAGKSVHHRRDLPLARPAGGAGRAVQGAEHVQQLDGRAGRGRDRPRAGDAGGRGRDAGRGGHEPGAAQARQRPAQPGRAARAGGRRDERRRLLGVGRGAGPVAGRRARRLRRPALPVRRGDLRGSGLAGRDQPAPQRHRQPGPRPGQEAAGHRRRRHRPGRRIRRPLRHPGAARRRRSVASQRLRHQQVPRPPRAPRPGPHPDRRADRPSGPRGAAVPGRDLDRRRGRRRHRAPVRRSAAGGGRDGAGGTPAGRGDPAAPHLQLHRHRRARARAGRRRPLRHHPGRDSPTPTWSSCRAPGPPSPTWAGSAARAWTSRSSAGRPAASPSWRSAAATRCSARSSTTTSRTRPRPTAASPGRRLRRAWPAAGGHPLRGRQDSRPPGRLRGAAFRSPATRSITAWSTCAAASRGSPASRRTAHGSAAALDGCRYGAVSGTLWHGILENDEFRRAYLTETARLAGRTSPPRPVPRSPPPGRPSSTRSPTPSKSTSTPPPCCG